MNEPCRRCGSEPTLATYYDFYRFHCPTTGCREHMGEWTIVNGKGRWYGTIDNARDAWNTRQKRGEATSAPQTAEPEPEPASAENEPQDGSKRKTKKQLRAEAVERLGKLPPMDMTGNQFVNAMVDPTVFMTAQDIRAKLIDLLTDDEPTCKPKQVVDKQVKQADYGTAEAETSQVPEYDTREKLEADIDEALDRDYITENQVLQWLDRQAAITKRQCEKREDEITDAWQSYLAKVEDERDELREQVDTMREVTREFREERDELKAFAKRLETAAHAKLGVTLFGVDYVAEEFMLHVRDTLTAERDEAYNRGYDDGLHANTQAAFSAARQALEAERDHLRNVVKQQAESFKKLEADLHALDSGETLNALRASVAGLKGTVEKQAETIDNQRDELCRFNAENHGAKRIPKGIRWPRHEDGKLVRICGLDAMTVKFDKTGCTIDYGFDQIERMSYDEIRGRERI